MNIISSNCLAGFIYKDILKTEFQNPFIWTEIDYAYFVNFIKNIYKIDYENVNVFTTNNRYDGLILTKVDDKYIFRNPHYKFKADATTIQKP